MTGFDDAPRSDVRRARFASRPPVGVRGQRTEQRILAAALQVFGQEGYHRTGIAQITEVTGGSRASFYRYFSSKEDVFRHLAGQVARQLAAAAEAVGEVTPDDAGRAEVRGWVARHAEIHARYEPVFRLYRTATRDDPVMAAEAAPITSRLVGLLASRVSATSLPARQLEPVLSLLIGSVTHTHGLATAFVNAAPDVFTDARIEAALTDAIHRTLFGRIAGVNDIAPEHPSAPRFTFDAPGRELLATAGPPDDLTAAGQRMYDTLIEAGRAAYVERGHDATRVDDVVGAAGVSHGTFYRHFRSVDDLAGHLAALAMRHVGAAMASLPTSTEAATAATLRAWLREFHATASIEAAVLHTWTTASAVTGQVNSQSPPVLDWGRRRIAAMLAGRGFGDVDADAIFGLAVLNSLSTTPSPATAIDAAVTVIRRALL